MDSPNKQYQIAQELSKYKCNVDSADYNIVGYELSGDFRIAVSSHYGMFPQTYIAIIFKLSQAYGFHFYITDTCSAIHDENMFIIIY